MTRIEHPFAETCRAVLKEKYPDREAAVSDGASLSNSNIPEDVISEALRRYYAGKKLIIGPHIHVHHVGAVPKQGMKRTITYV